ncbi:MAG: sugar ABC transporter ATP-binding protein [Armatimonadota bacterium]
MKGISKRFPGVLALDRVDLELYEGEILGLIGENGAGKSTLMRILGGDYPADDGTIKIAGEPVRIRDVRDSMSLGISVIYQELNLAPNLDIASNIFLGREPLRGPFGIVDRRRLYSQANDLAERVGINSSLTTLVQDLSPGEQQLVEVAKALSMDARILVLDEPTSSLSLSEVHKLFEVMRTLQRQNVSMIYISHRLAEVQEICDRVIVLRDGQRVGTLERAEGAGLSRDEMVKMMVGRDISRFFPGHGVRREGEIVLSVRNFRPSGGKGDICFDLHAGEILGVAGLVGAGRTEFVTSLFGIEPPEQGEIKLLGKKAQVRTPADAIRLGMGLVPEDRKQLGVILEMAVSENISLPSIGSYNPPFVDRKREMREVSRMVEALDIRAPSLAQQVQFLSGGNQQKVALGKWLALNPRILILDEPTRGIDVGSKSEIYKLIRDLADQGVGVIMVSSELEEIIGLSDRVMVMHEGCVTGILDREEISEENVMRLATGAIHESEHRD